MTSVLIRDRKGEDTQGLRGEGHVKMDAESGVMPPEDKEHQGWPGSHQMQGESRNGFSLRTPWKNQPCQNLDFRLQASRTVGEYMSVVLSLQVCGNLLWQP